MGAFFSKGRSNKPKFLICGSKPTKSEEKIDETAQIEEFMGPLDQLSSNPQLGDIEAEFKPLFPRKYGKHLDCKLHYIDIRQRDNLKVLCSLEPFQWKKIRCERGEKRGHYLAHFVLPKSFNKPFQFKFIVNNEYILIPQDGPNGYNAMVTHDGYINNFVDPTSFPMFNPENIGEVR